MQGDRQGVDRPVLNRTGKQEVMQFCLCGNVSESIL